MFLLKFRVRAMVCIMNLLSTPIDPLIIREHDYIKVDLENIQMSLLNIASVTHILT